jgi:hypothetical protein
MVVACLIGRVGAAPQPTTSDVFERPDRPVAAAQLDRVVFSALARVEVQPVLCSDGVFVRRAYLDVIGTLPTAKEARDFIQDPDTANKHRLLIDRLLEREEFADYWAMRWGDVLRIKAEFPVNLWPNAAQAYHRWVRASIAANKPSRASTATRPNRGICGSVTAPFTARPLPPIAIAARSPAKPRLSPLISSARGPTSPPI